SATRSRSSRRGPRQRLEGDQDMEVPILKQGPYLIATIQTALHDSDMLQLRDAIVTRVGKFRSRGVIVDGTSMDVMDWCSSRTLRDIAHMTRLRGAEMVIVGIQPEVAFAMVQLGLMFEDVPTALDLEEGLAFLDRRMKAPAMGGEGKKGLRAL